MTKAILMVAAMLSGLSAWAGGSKAPKQCCLPSLQVSPSGKLYRLRQASSGSFWQDHTVIDVAEGDGLFDDRQEFVGRFHEIGQADADSIRVVTGADGADHVYTLKKPGVWDTPRDGRIRVSRDGAEPVVAAGTVADGQLVDVTIGLDDKIYARYARPDEDDLLLLEGGAQSLVARLGIEMTTEKVWVPADMGEDCPGHWDYEDGQGFHWVSDGPCRKYVKSPGHYEDRPKRISADALAVDGQGHILSLYNGGVYRELGDGKRELVSKQDSVFGETELGGVNGFAIDPAGDLYVVAGGKLFINGEPSSAAFDSQIPLLVDSAGNVYTAGIDKIIRRIPASHAKAAQEPEPGAVALEDAPGEY